MNHGLKRIAILITGDEIMAGDLVDTNSAFICAEIAGLGARVSHVSKVPDDPNQITEELIQLTEKYDVVLINGGMGPTDDDHTVDCICRAFGLERTIHPGALAHLESWVVNRGYVLNEENRKQAYLPAGVEIIDNIGSCSGFYLHLNRSTVIATPGVPSELMHMWRVSIRDFFADRLFERKVVTRSFKTFGLGESLLQEKINESGLFKNSPVKLGFRASLPYVDVKLTGSIPDDEQPIHYISEELTELLGPALISKDGKSLPDVLFTILAQQSKRLAIAESCSGGYAASLLTSLKGISKVFLGGVVVYSNQLKNSILQVSEETLQRAGAVSTETALAMLENTLKITKADVAFSITGIAGPDGGSESKPVGTVFIGIGSPADKRVYKIYIRSGRERVLSLSAFVAMDLLRLFLSQNLTKPAYYFSCEQTFPLNS